MAAHQHVLKNLDGHVLELNSTLQHVLLHVVMVFGLMEKKAVMITTQLMEMVAHQRVLKRMVGTVPIQLTKHCQVVTLNVVMASI